MSFFDKYDEEIHIVLQITIFATGFLLVIGMWFYPDDYSFFNNFLSDLGRTVTTPNNIPNGTIMTLYRFTMTIGGLALILFFIIGLNPLKLVKGKDKSLDFRLILGSISGIFASFFMILSAWFPLDTMPDLHTIAGYLFFIPLGLSITLYSWYFIKYTEKTNSMWLYIIVILLAMSELMIFSKEISSILGPVRIIGSAFFLLVLFIVGILSLWYVLGHKGSLSERFSKPSEYLSFMVSVFIVLDIIITIVFLTYSREFKAVYEVAIVWPFLLWAAINNMRALDLSYQTN